ncbi:Transglutaminase elicitor-like protein [Phytophthora palmivora]|uniref:Transglutaminase elicitor-like protein n=1 Tax=Phytophthora palmivora TaxID=4796 RepID=A0A2P4YAZ1_9STRA|nr:Transglutaminase elicitor-like protein [Phytophthora palmivora]
MVFKPSTFLVLAAVTLAALQVQHADASSLEYDPYTTCTSYDIDNKNFPGRDSEIEDDGTCTVTVPEDPNRPPNRKLEEVYGDDIADLEAYFGTPLERKLKNLPTSAVYTPSPWAGSKWPTYLDSINYEWNKGEPSPAEKYATAFGLNVTVFKDSVSLQNGINSMNDPRECTTDKECFDPDVDTVCAKRAGKSSGFCIPTWYGMGHAWAPAAIHEKEPNCPVTYNGVTFQPMDIKALLTDVYTDANISYVFTGSRYNGYNDSIDEYGSHTDYSYRDLNPGYFHIASANLLGLLNTTFIIDREAGIEVWNQPVVGFEVYEQTSMTTEKAANTFYKLDEYIWNPNATSIVYVKSHLSRISETYTDGGLVASGLNDNFTVGTNYTYLLELNYDEEIVGGEWLYESNDIHPDFLWLPTSMPASDVVTSIGLSYANVTMLLEMAVQCFESVSQSVMKTGLTA